MARKARELSPNGLYYIELKGDSLFLTEADKEEFVKTAKNIFSDGGKIYGVFMSETLIRMVVKESVNGISAAMKSLTIVYARYVNKANGLTGKRFQGRFKSTPLDSEAAAKKTAKTLGDAPIPQKTATSKKSAPKPKTTVKKPAQKQSAKPEPPKAEGTQKSTKKQSLPSWLL